MAKQDTKQPNSKQPKATAEERAFNAINSVAKRGGHGSSLLTKVFGRWLKMPTSSDWVVDSEWAKVQQEPVRSRALLYGMLLAFIALIVWATFAEIDETVRGEGRVVPSSQLQRLQSLDGGVVQEILVREGQVVEAGETLLRIDPTRFVSDFRSQRAEYFALSGEVARLRALIAGTELSFPAELEESAAQVVSDETSLYESSLDELDQRRQVFEAQLSQRQNELAELRAASRQYRDSLALTRRELEVTQPLRRSGAVSEVELLRLEREVTILQGDFERTEASIARTQAAINEAEARLREVSVAMRNEWREQLNRSAARLSGLAAGESGLADRVRQSEIRTASRGIVQTLHVNTVGGVVTPGRDVVDIIPLNDQLIIEARIRPQDIAFLRPGQNAMIKFTAYDFMIYGGFAAEVRHISADTITDERDNTFYIVRLATVADEFPEEINIIPGMTTDVDIITGKRTVMQYLLKPILRATSMALSER
ncbi:HlyD family type I secretion periplasmic adaptor subunit [Aliidiomarina maris]|uniref:Membrane fusion protein (MFP) family protein n=1 Tax=Aliidiomarina maris TaxID=531312 RepID=A0A327WLQ4_9GAMM|nr:HlyD family type I secretion periplasmic adaptor subunit [Aliidiomarina maris]RAJ92953.1 adhesin transport system membrane fusion protein [Aliidiomarina maris]RUO20102.1 HlyD family type I secretion periplasmic adaptor subunit [Aliidiomarina maris]